jgi:hypothetical protein
VYEQSIERALPMFARDCASSSQIAPQHIALAEHRNPSKTAFVERDLEPHRLEVASIDQRVPERHPVRNMAEPLLEHEPDPRPHE